MMKNHLKIDFLFACPRCEPMFNSIAARVTHVQLKKMFLTLTRLVSGNRSGEELAAIVAQVRI